MKSESNRFRWAILVPVMVLLASCTSSGLFGTGHTDAAAFAGRQRRGARTDRVNDIVLGRSQCCAIQCYGDATCRRAVAVEHGGRAAHPAYDTRTG